MSLQQVGLALRNYSEEVGHLPFPVRQEWTVESADNLIGTRTGGVLYSWRVEIVPYLMSWHGSWEPHQPWISPANRVLAELSSFYNFADSTKPAPGDNKAFPETNVMAITGPGTGFGDGRERPKALKDVPASMILVVETRASGIPWPAPGDFDISTMPQTINAPDGTYFPHISMAIISNYRGGCNGVVLLSGC
jgi:hypothetical protein